MSHRPTAPELLEAVQEHLSQRVLPSVHDPQLKFQTLVAAHVLGVVSRELTEGALRRREALQKRENLHSGALGDRALCEAIRAGDFDPAERHGALCESLRGEVEAELLIWNPLFLWRMRSAPAGEPR